MLVNQLTSANLESLLLYDPDLFANMKIPMGMEKTMVVQAIRRKHGLAPLYHPDPIWMKSELFFWSTENLPIWEKLLATTQLKYNPIWNTDAHIITKDTTTRDRDTAAQHIQKSNGDITEKAQHAGSKDGWNTDGTLYHEDTTGDGWNTGTDARHGDTSGTAESQTHGTSHTDTDGTSHMEKDGKTTSDTAGTRLTAHNETQTDDLTTTKVSTTDVEGKISSENEANYQPYDAQHTDYDEKGTALDRKAIDWTENETTGSTTKGTSNETDDGTTHETSDTETTGQETQLTTGHSDEIGRQSSEYGDKGSTAARGHTEGKTGERETAHDAKAGTHSDTTHGMETGKEKETVSVIHEESRGGNIGVTTTQAMIKEERESVLFNVYDFIADSFHRTFCLDVY